MYHLLGLSCLMNSGLRSVVMGRGQASFLETAHAFLGLASHNDRHLSKHHLKTLTDPGGVPGNQNNATPK